MSKVQALDDLGVPISVDDYVRSAIGGSLGQVKEIYDVEAATAYIKVRWITGEVTSMWSNKLYKLEIEELI